MFTNSAAVHAALALLLPLAALLPAFAVADGVTTELCKARFSDFDDKRIRRYPVDEDATYLNMHHCGLTDVEIFLDDFENLPNVDEIHLFANNIEHINLAILHSVPTLTKLFLHINKIRELPIFDQRSCPKLTELILGDNLVTELNNAMTFSACVKLQKIYLSRNKIDYIHPDIFASLPELRKLYLSGNKIRYITNKLFERNVMLQNLQIDNNRLTFLPEGFVTNLKKTGVNLKHFYFYDNPWHCACLVKLLVEVNREGVPYYKRDPFYPKAILDTKIMHYNGTRPECMHSQQKSFVCPN